MEEIVSGIRRADITFYASGRIDISSGVARTLGLKAGDVIGVLESKGKDAGELYLHVRSHAPLLGRHEGAVFPAKNGFRSFRAYSGRMARYVMGICLAACGKEEADRVRLAVGEPARDKWGELMLPIIYKNML